MKSFEGMFVGLQGDMAQALRVVSALRLVRNKEFTEATDELQSSTITGKNFKTKIL